MRVLNIAFAVVALGLASVAAAADQLPATWDNLHVVDAAKNMKAVYLLPGADFRTYSKVMLDPTEVAFKKDWQKDAGAGPMPVSDYQAKKIADTARTGMEDVFAKAYADAGFQVVTAAAPDVLRVKTIIADLYLAAPEIQAITQVSQYSVEAGDATFIIEVRDSMTGAVLGRAVDHRAAGDVGEVATLRTSATNKADFVELFKAWAKVSANGLTTLKNHSPVNPGN